MDVQKIDALLIFGCNCVPCHYAKHANLRRFSGPLDSFVSHNDEKMLDLVQTGFKDFLYSDLLWEYHDSPHGKKWTITEEKYRAWLCHGYNKDGKLAKLEDLSINDIRNRHIKTMERYKYVMENAETILAVRLENYFTVEDVPRMKKILSGMCKGRLILLFSLNEKHHTPTKSFEYVDLYDDPDIITFSFMKKPVEQMSETRWIDVFKKFELTDWYEKNKESLKLPTETCF